MALSDFMNKDPFAAGGVMDAPDLQVRTAMFKVAAGIPVDNKEMRRLMIRQGLEQQSINTAQENARMQSLLGMRNVDVKSYAGSMWSKPGSYTAARPIAPQGGYNPEATADAILKQRFGEMQPGQVQVSYGGSREGQNQVLGVPQPSPKPSSTAITQLAGIPVGQYQDVTMSNASGVVGPTPEALATIQTGPGGSGANSGQVSMPGLQPNQDYSENAFYKLPQKAKPTLEMLMGQGLPSQTQTQAAVSPSLSAYSAPQVSPDIQQINAINQSYSVPSYKTALEVMTPRQQEMAQQEQHFIANQQRMKAAEDSKQRIATATSMIAMGQDPSQLGLSQSEFAQASMKGQQAKEKADQARLKSAGTAARDAMYVELQKLNIEGKKAQAVVNEAQQKFAETGGAFAETKIGGKDFVVYQPRYGQYALKELKKDKENPSLEFVQGHDASGNPVPFFINTGDGKVHAVPPDALLMMQAMGGVGQGAAPAGAAPKAQGAGGKPSFATLEEAQAAKLKPGTKITIGGRPATVQ